MRQYSREEKLRLAGQIIKSSEWEFLDGEIEKQLGHIQGRIDSATETGDTNKLFAACAQKIAFEFVRNLPKKLLTENTIFLDRLYKKIAAE